MASIALPGLLSPDALQTRASHALRKNDFLVFAISAPATDAPSDYEPQEQWYAVPEGEVFGPWDSREELLTELRECGYAQ